VDGHYLTLITAGLSSITLITGFVVFATVRRARAFDRRLVLSGYRPSALIAAKTCGALVQAVAIGAYAAIIMLFFWRPAGLWAIAVTFMLAAATYAALGLLIGVLVRGDLEGFFLIIMISMLDTFLENPVDNPLANKSMLEFFPSYGPLAWTAVFALLGLAVLRLRMPRPARAAAPSRVAAPSAGPSPAGTPSSDPHHQRLTAAVAQTSGGPGRNPGESGLAADQRVVPPPAARPANTGRSV
jgi:ABC-2 type transport system permease protein